MRGLIILDGPDGAGKTTLAKRICERFSGKYIHMTYRWKDSMFEYHTAALHHAISLSNKQLMVIDRLWMSELIYAAVYREGSKWPHMGRMMDRVIRKHAGMYVVCAAKTARSHTRMFETLKTIREEMYEETTGAWAMYRLLMDGCTNDSSLSLENGVSYYDDLVLAGGLKSRGDVWEYSIDVEGKDLDGYIDRLVHCVQLRREEQALPALHHKMTNMLGYAPEAKYLFVGDRLSDTRYRALGWPFYQYSDCSLYMTEQLSKIGFDETKACWVNGNEAEAVQIVDWLTSDKYNLKPIFFGADSAAKFSTALSINGQESSAIRHPQYYRRWRHNTDQFIQDITEAMRKVDEPNS